MPRFPDRILWVWERAEDLRFLDPDQVGVAFLAGTIALRSGDFSVHPRLQPLRFPSQTFLMAVVRIESRGSDPISTGQATHVATAIARLLRLPGVEAVQVDFDARTSERGFYRDVLQELRLRLPATMPLSITALASWCLGDNWLDGLPVDEAVAMLFRMGVDDRSVRSHLAAGGDFTSPVCRQSVGVSTDEPLPKLPSGRRIYIFHPQPWSPTAAQKALAEVDASQ